MSNVAYIYQPHFKSHKFRVALNDQEGVFENFIVVTCSPAYNGVWSYPSANLKEKNYEIWKNGRLECVCVPIEDCERFKTLEELKNPVVIENVKKQQKTWLKNQCNTDYGHNYKNKPDWMLE